MTRKEMIEFLTGLKNGTRSISELAKPGVETHVLIQRDKDEYTGSNGKSFTSKEIKDLAGTVVIIKNPHLKD